MDWTSGWRKTCLTKSVCHSHFRGSMRSLTLESSKVLFGREITLKVDGLGNHLSIQMPNDASFPTYHLQPCLTIFALPLCSFKQKKVEIPVQPQGSHYLGNSELLKLYGPVMTYLSKVTTPVWLKVKN